MVAEHCRGRIRSASTWLKCKPRNYRPSPRRPKTAVLANVGLAFIGLSMWFSTFQPDSSGRRTWNCSATSKRLHWRTPALPLGALHRFPLNKGGGSKGKKMEFGRKWLVFSGRLEDGRYSTVSGITVASKKTCQDGSMCNAFMFEHVSKYAASTVPMRTLHTASYCTALVCRHNIK